MKNIFKYFLTSKINQCKRFDLFDLSAALFLFIYIPAASCWREFAAVPPQSDQKIDSI